MSSLESLYQQVILDQAKRRTGSGDVSGFEFTSFQTNPTCGDEVTLGVATDSEGNLTQIAWDGDGCSISQAALSILVENVQDRDLATIKRQFSNMETMMHSRGTGTPEEILDELGDGAALEGSSKFPNRIKCSLLGWYALRDAMAQAGFDITAEE